MTESTKENKKKEDTQNTSYQEVLSKSVDQLDYVISESMQELKQQPSKAEKIKLLALISSSVTKKTDLYKDHHVLQKSNEKLNLSKLLGWTYDQTDS